MDKRVLDSKLAVQNADRYAIGVMTGGGLHISPLTAILHMRPSFDFLNVGDERRRKKEAQEEDSAEGELLPLSGEKDLSVQIRMNLIKLPFFA